MLTYIIRRTLYMLPLLLIVSLISFTLIKIMPGDYLTLARLNPQITEETLQQQIDRFGLDRPFIVQYGYWLKNIVMHGDFGMSFDTKMPVYKTLFMGNRLQWTVFIAVTTLFLQYLFAIPIGIYSATHQYKPSDHIVTFFGFLGLSIPNFFFALVLLWLLVVVFRVGDHGLTVGGVMDLHLYGAPLSWAKIVNIMWHLWPVWLVIGTSGMAGLIRLMRGNLLDTLSLPYVQTARAKGLKERVVVYKHAVRNAINPLVTILGLSLPGLVGGSVVVAIVLNLPT
ncbi:ABC transporter permease, partial [Candidatus Bipolaricaulota bacterium]|nr:ABC transporter permease [Candidatus Bipolaricaulota bacterium]